jgi:hypothetical protein
MGEGAGGGADIDEQTWPATLVDAGEVRRWISSVLPGLPPVIGPLLVHQAKEWGVTASFAAAGAQAREVVFKAAAHPLFVAAPHIYELLSRSCAGSVPELLAWTQPRLGQTWSLFAAFEGPTIQALHTPAALLQLVRVFARIQTQVAVLPAAALDGLPRTPPGNIPAYFDAVLLELRERQQPLWRGRASQLAQQFHLPDDAAERLVAFRAQVQRWTEELLGSALPASIDHVDLHWENAVVQPNGRILIYDWEEATISCPLFSLDRLLNDARELDLGEAAAWCAAADQRGLTPTEHALRNAYLDALPWGTREMRERAFDLALCLAPIKTAYETMAFADALGWGDEPSLGAAWAVSRMLARWPRQALP